MTWLTTLCNEVESKAEYTRSINEFYAFLKEDDVIEDLGEKCVEQIIVLADKLQCKERHLANYIRMFTTNCMDAHTTSPVECQNRVMKYSDGVSANKNVDKSLACATKAASSRINKRNNKAIREMDTTLLSSNAKTRGDIIAKAQYLADINFDSRVEYNGMYSIIVVMLLFYCIYMSFVEHEFAFKNN